MQKTTIAVLLSLPFLAFPQGLQLSLKRGVFVREPYKCENAPNAAIRAWDGVGLSGAHSGKCATRVLSQHGRQFQVSTACSASGDGAPDTSGYAEALFLTRQSDTRFVISKAGQPEGTYRWCNAKP